MADGPRKARGAGGELPPVPPGYTTVTPWIISTDTPALVSFIERAFGGTELARLVAADGAVEHCEIRIGDAIVMAFDTRPGWPATPAFLRLYLPDGDAAHRRALDAGAESVTAMTDLFFGDRVGRVRDPLGNLWWIQTRVDAVAPEEAGRRAAQPEYAAAMGYVQDSLDQALRA